MPRQIYYWLPAISKSGGSIVYEHSQPREARLAFAGFHTTEVVQNRQLNDVPV